MTRRRHDDTHYPGWCKNSGTSPKHKPNKEELEALRADLKKRRAALAQAKESSNAR